MRDTGVGAACLIIVAGALAGGTNKILQKPAMEQEHLQEKSSKDSFSSYNMFTRPNQNPNLNSPLIQLGEDPDPTTRERRDFVKTMMKNAWTNYVQYAWGKNELRPISQHENNASMFGLSSMGTTIVDSLDTLYIMGMEQEFQHAREWIKINLDMSKMMGDVSMFDINIRYVGSLLTAFAFTGDNLFKVKAAHIVDKMLPAFNTPTGIPYALVNMQSGNTKNFEWASGGSSILSDFRTLHIEFAYLSDITGNPVYREKVEKDRNFVANLERPGKKLYPNYLHPQTGKWGQQDVSVGAFGDSF